ncbi:MAG: hypothetical protein Q6366_005685 [Candidatus Freyarchaeota archaeon]
MSSGEGKTSENMLSGRFGGGRGRFLSWAWLLGIALSFVVLVVQHTLFPGAILELSLTHIHHWMYSLPIVVLLVVLKFWKPNNFWIDFMLGFFVGLVVSEFYWILLYGFPKGLLQILYWILITGEDYNLLMLIMAYLSGA